MDAVVSDLDLGVSSGLDVLRAAKETRPACARILVSGGADPVAVAAAMRDRIAHRFIAKPWASGTVRETLRSLLPRPGGPTAAPATPR